MNGLSIYGVAYDPFAKGNCGRAPFQSRDHREAVGLLNTAKDEGGLVVVTAPPGMGKSYSIKCFADGLDRQRYHVGYTTLSTVSSTEFYRQLSAELGVEAKYRKTAMYRAVKERILELYNGHCRPVIIVDEAQDLDFSVLRELKSLLSFRMDTLNCLTLVLSGEPHLNSVLKRQAYESLNQRIQYHYHFRGLSVQETADYIRHKITSAGGSPSIADGGAVETVAGLSKGNARMTDRIMSGALRIGAQQERPFIDTEVVSAAFDQMQLP